MKWLLGYILMLLPILGQASTLTFTLPTQARAQWIEWDPELQDSVLHVECFGTAALHDSLLVKLYGQPITGGGFKLIAWHSTLAFGQPDSFVAPWPGNFYVTASNRAGESCASDPVTVMPTDVTGVLEIEGERVLFCRLFDIHGRSVRSLPPDAWSREVFSFGLASGVYWLRATTSRGKHWTRKVVILR
jgi:hypothetical protein